MAAIVFLICLLQTIVALVSAEKINFTVPKSISENIFLNYYYGPTLNDYIVLKLEDGLNLTQQQDFDVNKTTNFFYHGWSENATSGCAVKIVEAFLNKTIRNAVAFDYGRLVRGDGNLLNYVSSTFNATCIGQAIGEFFKLYIPAKQVVKLVRMIGHSLGAQIVSKVARVFGSGKLRLTGLDPAGPLYNLPISFSNLNASDGSFVDIMHTDAGFFGDGSSRGTVDFFPNNGTRYQPGCDVSLNISESFCSHTRACDYYAESIKNATAFLAKKCNRVQPLSYCCCNDSDVTYMGYSTYTNQKVTLLFFNRKEEDILCREHLDKLQSEESRLTVSYILSEPQATWSGHSGHVSGSLVRGAVANLVQDTHLLPTDVFACVCGPTVFTNLARSLLGDMGYRPEHMHCFLG